jgi:hypothetical protein
MPSALLDVLLDRTLKVLAGGHLGHLFLPFQEPVLGIVELAQLMNGKSLHVRDRHRLQPPR